MTNTEDITALLGSFYDSFWTGEASWLDQLGEDVVAIGTDESEWWAGRDVVSPALRTQLTAMSREGLRVKGGTPVVGEAGDVVWAADQPTLHLFDGSEQPLRVTVVATRVETGLVLQQLHLSSPTAHAD